MIGHDFDMHKISINPGRFVRGGEPWRVHAERLHQDGYRIEYIEFDGGHQLTPEMVEKAVAFFLTPRE